MFYFENSETVHVLGDLVDEVPGLVGVNVGLMLLHLTLQQTHYVLYRFAQCACASGHNLTV